MNMIPTVILFLVIVTVYGTDKRTQQFDDKLHEKNSALDSIRLELNRGRKRIQELSKKEGVYLEQLEALEITIEASRLYIEGMTGKIDTLSVYIQSLNDSLVTFSRLLLYRQQKMRLRLRNIYMLGQPRLVEIVLTSGSITDLINRVKYFQRLHRYDQTLLHSIDSMRALVSANKTIVEREHTRQRELKESKEQEMVQLQRQQEHRQRLLTEVQEEKKAYQAMIKELERAQSELTALVKTLEVKRRKAKKEYEQGLLGDFSKRKGTLAWPVDGVIIRNFGRIVHPVYQTVTQSNGIDIKAPRGDTVRCVAAGMVEYIGWMRGYGRFLIVNHFGDYSTIYAHLDKVFVEQEQMIRSGDELGVVGETGSLNGAKLHFQIRKSSETVDPLQWLQKK